MDVQHWVTNLMRYQTIAMEESSCLNTFNLQGKKILPYPLQKLLEYQEIVIFEYSLKSKKEEEEKNKERILFKLCTQMSLCYDDFQ